MALDPLTPNNLQYFPTDMLLKIPMLTILAQPLWHIRDIGEKLYLGFYFRCFWILSLLVQNPMIPNILHNVSPYFIFTHHYYYSNNTNKAFSIEYEGQVKGLRPSGSDSRRLKDTLPEKGQGAHSWRKARANDSPLTKNFGGSWVYGSRTWAASLICFGSPPISPKPETLTTAAADILIRVVSGNIGGGYYSKHINPRFEHASQKANSYNDSKPLHAQASHKAISYSDSMCKTKTYQSPIQEACKQNHSLTYSKPPHAQASQKAISYSDSKCKTTKHIRPNIEVSDTEQSIVVHIVGMLISSLLMLILNTQRGLNTISSMRWIVQTKKKQQQ